MTTTEPPARRPPFLAVVLNYLAYVFLLAICAVGLFLAWPVVMARLSGTPAPGEARPTPAATNAPAVRGQDRQFVPADIRSAPVVPLPGIAQNEATSTAMYQATAAAANAASAPLPNVDTLPADAPPVQLGSRPADRQPAGENVPTAEPIVPVTDWFGTKQAPVDIQTTHECKHGQVWTERGCKNPTPIGAQP